MIDEWGEKVLMWLMEGPEAGYNRGAHPGPLWGSLEPHRLDILKQPWMASMNVTANRVYCTDHEALIMLCLREGVLTKDEADVYMARITLALMGG